MRYLSIYRPESGQEGGMPSPEHMAAMGRLIESQRHRLAAAARGLPRPADVLARAFVRAAAERQVRTVAVHRRGRVRAHRRVGVARRQAEQQQIPAGYLVPAELHVYSAGGHGYGLRPGKPCDTWPARVEEWMKSAGMLKAATAK